MMKGMVFAERYKLEEFIGQGGMSLVYRAVDIRTGHSVAVKILKSEYNSDKEFLERFQREAQAASLMSHHNIVNLLDVGVEGEYRYLVLEYVSGNTLKDIIRQRGRLNAATAIQVSVRILSALQHAHDNGIIHRDIKPQNVLIHSDGHVKVADFGIARMTNAFTISKGDTVVGSVHYSSPEQATGSVVEATSDIYSAGVVMYEMLTGRVPFVGDTPVSVAMQHINDVPPHIHEFAPETPPAVVAVVMKALAKAPVDRYQSAREMADALLRAKEGKVDPDAAVLTAQTYSPPAAPPVKKNDIPPQPRSHSGGRSSKRMSRKKLRTIIATVSISAALLALLVLGVIGIYTNVLNSTVAPDVVGMTREEGMAQAKRMGLNWQEKGLNHATIPAGQVIDQLPEAEADMRKGDSLLVTVSLGPQSNAMPSVTGMNYEEATTSLQGLGFSIVLIRTTSTEPLGRVLAQNPQAGGSYAIGQSVELTISGGSTLVPDVAGKTLDEATALLKDSSLTMAEPQYQEVLDAQQVGKVMAQEPIAGTLVVMDAPVTLTIAKAAKQFKAETLVELTAADHDRELLVVLMENGGEAEQYRSMYAAGQSGPMIIPVSSDQSGPMICRIYLDGKIFAEIEVNLQ
ncbi:MAG: Stk1 family PASTA domain-containing Ser/Thr kinase [Clostridiales bacterium]|nr:Stk1 family PASTA domain-containing Ser/Thr kinase [Clostridiales bacterium]